MHGNPESEAYSRLMEGKKIKDTGMLSQQKVAHGAVTRVTSMVTSFHAAHLQFPKRQFHLRSRNHATPNLGVMTSCEGSLDSQIET